MTSSTLQPLASPSTPSPATFSYQRQVAANRRGASSQRIRGGATTASVVSQPSSGLASRVSQCGAGADSAIEPTTSAILGSPVSRCASSWRALRCGSPSSSGSAAVLWASRSSS